MVTIIGSLIRTMDKSSPESKGNPDSGKQHLQSRPNSAGILSPVTKQVKLFQFRRNKVSDFSDAVSPDGGQIRSAGPRIRTKSATITSCGGKIDPSAIAAVLTSKEYIGPDVLIILGSLLLLIGLGVVLLGMYAPSGIDELQSMIFTIGPSMMGIGLLFTCLRLLFWKPRLCVCCRRFDKKKEAAQKSARSLKVPGTNNIGVKPKVGRPRTTLAGRVPNPMLTSATRMRAGSMGHALSLAGSARITAVNGTRGGAEGSKQPKCNCNPSSPCENCKRKLREIAQEGLQVQNRESQVGGPPLRPQVPASFRLSNYETAVLIDDKGMGQAKHRMRDNRNDTSNTTSNDNTISQNKTSDSFSDSGVGNHQEDIAEFLRQEEERDDKDGFYSSGNEDDDKDSGNEKNLQRTASQEFEEAFKETMKNLGENPA